MLGVLPFTFPSPMSMPSVRPYLCSRRATASHVAANCATLATSGPTAGPEQHSQSTFTPLRLCLSTVDSSSSANASRRTNAAGGKGVVPSVCRSFGVPANLSGVF